MILSWKYTAERTGTFLTGRRDPNSPFLGRNQDRDVVKQGQGLSLAASSWTGLQGPMEDRWAVAGSRTEVENKTNANLQFHIQSWASAGGSATPTRPMA